MTQELAALLEAQYGKQTAENIGMGYEKTRPVTFRANRLKGDRDMVAAFRERGICVRRIGWYPDAYVAESVREDAIRATDLYADGEIYLQSLSSMLPPLFLDPQPGESILDMTAAPGGKTTQLCALTGNRALVTACERDKVRFGRMKFNFERQGATRVTAICADALALDDAFSFDKILLDAPCTGSGTLSPAKPVRFSSAYLEKCAALQEKLIKKALRLLKRGGTLVYSTCSVLRRENEEAVERCLRGTACAVVPVEPPAGVPLLPCGAGMLCVCPTELYEGFFLAKIKKN